MHLFRYRGKSYAFNPATLDVVAIKKRASTHEKNGSGEGLAYLEDSGSFQVMVNVSQTCNLACTYCFTDEGQFAHKEPIPSFLTEEMARKLVQTMPQANPNSHKYRLHFYGGEPLLNIHAIRACVEEAERMEDKLFEFSITTNGSLVNDEIITLLERGNFTICLSIDGPPEIHNQYRKTKNGEGTHSRVMNFLERVRKNTNCRIQGSSVIRSGWSLKSAIKYLKTLPVDLFKAQAVRVDKADPMALSPAERAEYVSHLSEVAADVIEALEREESPRDDRLNSFLMQLILKKRRRYFCEAGSNMFGMSSNGRFYLCSLLAGRDSADLGTLQDAEFQWLGRGKTWAAEFQPQSKCADCWALPLCGGGCLAMNSVCGGDDCDYIRGTCEAALKVYTHFKKKKKLHDLLIIAGITGSEQNII